MKHTLKIAIIDHIRDTLLGKIEGSAMNIKYSVQEYFVICLCLSKCNKTCSICHRWIHGFNDASVFYQKQANIMLTHWTSVIAVGNCRTISHRLRHKSILSNLVKGSKNVKKGSNTLWCFLRFLEFSHCSECEHVSFLDEFGNYWSFLDVHNYWSFFKAHKNGKRKSGTNKLWVPLPILLLCSWWMGRIISNHFWRTTVRMKNAYSLVTLTDKRVLGMNTWMLHPGSRLQQLDAICHTQAGTFPSLLDIHPAFRIWDNSFHFAFLGSENACSALLFHFVGNRRRHPGWDFRIDNRSLLRF